LTPVCAICERYCNTCASSGTDCTSCKEGSFLKIGDLTGECITNPSNCGAAQYGNTTTRTCTSCNIACT